jgi:antitoxin component YwqK of YwqJK toxin-antitoxin module
MKRILLWASAVAIFFSGAVCSEEFKCLEGAEESGPYRPGDVVRYCKIWRDGRLLYHGSVWRWHRNGQMKSKEYYVYGKAEGETPSWYENGRMSSLGSFKNGSKSGLWKHWDESGRIKTEVTYAEADSLWTEYYPSGQKKAVGTFARSGKIGLWVYWDNDGKEKARCDFGEGLFNIPTKACQIIADELEPKGYSRPIPVGVKTEDRNAAVRIASQLYEFTTPYDWVVDLDAGKADRVPLAFYPKGGTWRGSGPNIYIRVLYKDGRSYDKIVASEAEGFQRKVASYTEKSVTRGKLRNGTSSFTRTISYKPLIQTDSPFSIISDNLIHETISYLDAADQVVLVAVLACHREAQLEESTPALTSIITSLHVQSEKGKAP